VLALATTAGVQAQTNTLDKAGLSSATPAAAAYSLRLLSSTYTGPLVRITNSSNRKYYDVYPNASGVFALNSPISAAYTISTAAVTGVTGNLLSSVVTSTTSATLAIWYDQSGNGYDLYYAGAQNLLIQSGSIAATFGSNNMPAIQCVNGAKLNPVKTLTNGSIINSIDEFCVVALYTNNLLSSNGGGSTFFQFGTNAAPILALTPWSNGVHYFDAGNSANLRISSFAGTINTPTINVYCNSILNNTKFLAQNNRKIASGVPTPTGAATVSSFSLFASQVTGICPEFIVFATAIETSRQALQSNIISTYGMPITWSSSGSGGSTDWNTASNWYPTTSVPTAGQSVLITSNSVISSAVVAPASITIMPGGSLTIATGGSFTGTAPKVTIQSSPNGVVSGSLVNTAGVPLGNTTIQQWFVGQRGWRVVAHPFTTTQAYTSIAANSGTGVTSSFSGMILQTNTQNTASGQSDIRTYNNTTGAWQDAYTTTNTAAAANTAYAVFNRGVSGDLNTDLTYKNNPQGHSYTVAGTPNSGANFAVPAANAANFSLVGNPFTAPVSSAALTGGASSTLPYYVYKDSVTATPRVKAGAWVPVVAASATDLIPVLGVIAVKTAGGYNIPATAMTTTGTIIPKLFGTDPATAIVELQLNKNGDYQDKLMVRMADGATANGTDKADLDKFNNDDVNIYTLTPDQKMLAVDARAALNSEMIPLGISASAADYTFTVNNNSLPAGVTAYLVDKFTGTQTELKAGASYSFSVTADASTVGNNRFVMMFTGKQAVIAGGTTAFTAQVIGNVVHGNSVQVNIAGSSSPITIAVRDINGKIINTAAGINGLNTVNIGNGAAGLHLLQISNAQGSITEKIIKL
jgi:hypothetical protein